MRGHPYCCWLALRDSLCVGRFELLMWCFALDDIDVGVSSVLFLFSPAPVCFFLVRPLRLYEKAGAMGGGQLKVLVCLWFPSADPSETEPSASMGSLSPAAWSI